MIEASLAGLEHQRGLPNDQRQVREGEASQADQCAHPLLARLGPPGEIEQRLYGDQQGGQDMGVKGQAGGDDLHRPPVPTIALRQAQGIALDGTA